MVESMEEGVYQRDSLEKSDKLVQHCADSQLKDDDSIRTKYSDDENDSEVVSKSSANCSENCGHQLSLKYSCYPNGITRLTDSSFNVSSKSSVQIHQNCEERKVMKWELGNNELNDKSSHTKLKTGDMLPGHTCSSESNSAPADPTNGKKCAGVNHVTSGKSSTTTEENESTDISEDSIKTSTAGDNQLAEVSANDDNFDPQVDDSIEKPSADRVCETSTQHIGRTVDSPQPLDFSMTGAFAKMGNGGTVSKKQSDSPVQQGAHKPSVKQEVKSDNYRPLGRLLHDLGLELVREQVYRDLIDIQQAKDTRNQLEERERGQLLKLMEARDRLALRNAPYLLPTKRCSRCSFMSSSMNVMILHQEFGTTSRIDSAVHVCCLCSGHPGFRTRNAVQFVAHLSTDHGLSGRVQKKTGSYMCENCQFEHKSPVRLAVHMEKCSKKFSLATNLQPLPGDCDMPLIYRPSDRNRPFGLPLMPSTTSSDGPFAPTGPSSVRTLLSSLRQQVPGHSGFLHSQLVVPSIICEICGKLVDSRDALWSHFRCAHHVELCRTTMHDKEPWMKCDVCSGRFWTYQGLSRHLLLAHNRALATSFPSGTTTSPAVARCHLCGGSQTSNPLTHFSAYHNVTLLEMYHAKLCCLCNRKVNSGRAFEEHMVTQHSDIFANHDVLRTVLQALTTARYFKADDTREPTTQQIRQLTGGIAGDVSTSVPSYAKNKHPDHAQDTSTTGSSRNSVVADKTTLMSASKSPRSSHSKQITAVSSLGADHSRKSTPYLSETKHNSGEACSTYDETKLASTPVTQKSPVKVKNKCVSVEEVKKLYEDLSDLGRPILRSMRRKLSSDCNVKNYPSETSKETVSGLETSIRSPEIPAKKVHLQSSDEPCNDTVNC